MPPKGDAHKQLDILHQRVSDAQVAEGDADAKREAAETALEMARDDVREAHDLGTDPAKATKALEKAKKDVEQAHLACEGLAHRVQRAEAEVLKFKQSHGFDLLHEREVVAKELAGSLTRAVHEVIRLDRAIGAERSHINLLLAVIPGVSPREDGPPSEHPWEAAIRELRRATGWLACARAGGAEKTTAA
jgi:hypothetical protein